jgi:hypothetical protein
MECIQGSRLQLVQATSVECTSWFIVIRGEVNDWPPVVLNQSKMLGGLSCS